mmetsp:Transcript_15114/g.33339  ORF Transcript_15114/g.33339 Transcript_15114/m.33339 type:complete len:279 (+) Transcript_15114:1567-2403(+)
MLHIDLRPQHRLALLKLPCTHVLEELQILLHRPVPESAVGAIVPAILDLGAILLVDVCLALLNEEHCPLVQGVEIVRGKIQVLTPVVAKPLHVLLDTVDILHFLRGRVGVVKSQVAPTAVFLSKPEIQDDALGVTQVEVPIGLRGEPGPHTIPLGSAVAPAPRRHTGFNQLLQKVLGLFRGRAVGKRGSRCRGLGRRLLAGLGRGGGAHPCSRNESSTWTQLTQSVDVPPPTSDMSVHLRIDRIRNTGEQGKIVLGDKKSPHVRTGCQVIVQGLQPTG